ncbi:hypothetical protein LOTGIDRAFT_56145 [Rhizophagus clarus]|uniref:Endonuclease/exonuclease/phosphatase domain-containing protein n=1 Tax=Rhizophagus clarus TaxID=94130 RepID=A0A8H3MG47_9GLOM|nr:hypothetical protein LOTGIDRAFT_56145 [Rhizophagus clarus]
MNVRGGPLDLEASFVPSEHANPHRQEITEQLDANSAMATAIDNFLARNRLIFEENCRNQIDNNNLHLQLKIATHNINGCNLLDNLYKLETLLQLMKVIDIDIITLSDMNLDEKKGHFINERLKTQQSNYKIIFGLKDSRKSKGSGTAIIINSKWEKHIRITDRISPYITRISLLFSKREIWIWAIYAAPQDKDDVLQVLGNKLQDIDHNAHIQNGHRTLHIVAGDFNEILDPTLDKVSSTTNGPIHKPSNFFRNITQLGFKDTLREIEPNKQVFTYNHTNRRSQSRIDYIWISHCQDVCVTAHHNLKAEDITNSDHTIVITELYVGDFLLQNRKHTRMRPTPREDDKHYPMKYIDTTKLTGDTWDNFSRTLIDEFQAWNFDDSIEELAVLHAPNNDDQTAGMEPEQDYLII